MNPMEFPHGHEHHHHHRNRDDDEPDENEQRFPPPSRHNQPNERADNYYPHNPRPEYFDPPSSHHHSHHGPPPQSFYDRPDYSPAFEPHRVYGAPSGYFYGEGREQGNLHHPIQPIGHLEVGAEGRAVARKVNTVRVFTKAHENYSLSVLDGSVVLARANPNDEYQHWIKDLKYSTRVKDKEGFPGFALVNKATGQALKHSIGATHPVQLIPYNPDYLDESVLWTESRDLGDGFRCIRMVNNIRLNFDAFHGDEDHGGVHDGTTLVLWEWLQGNNQRWKVVPY